LHVASKVASIPDVSGTTLFVTAMPSTSCTSIAGAHCGAVAVLPSIVIPVAR
jgi:hypothetical protein